MKDQFKRGGFLHRLVKREGRIALYERSREGSENIHWEVVRIREHAAYELAGERFPAGEHYPFSESWGRDGFTYTDRASAEERFAEMVRTEKP